MKVLLSIGDVSAANYISRIFKDITKDLDIYGITTKKLREIGIRSVGDINDIAATGLTEIIPKLKRILKVKKSIVNQLKDTDVLIVCDAPAFNIPLIKKAKKMGVNKVIYFISPQVWAWKKGRIKDIVNFSDHLIVILPFEVELYKSFESKTFKVHYVGHPLVDIVKPEYDEISFKRKFEITGNFIGIFPGSRSNEIEKMGLYYRRIYESVFGGKGFYGIIPTFIKFKYDLESIYKGNEEIIIYADDDYNFSYEVMKYSNLSLITSGTASLEAFLLGNPHLIFYRVSKLTYMVAKLVVNIDSINLPNIILREKIVPEIIQKDWKEAAKIVEKKKDDISWLERFKEKSEELRYMLGDKNVIPKLKDLFLELIYS